MKYRYRVFMLLLDGKPHTEKDLRNHFDEYIDPIKAVRRLLISGQGRSEKFITSHTLDEKVSMGKDMVFKEVMRSTEKEGSVSLTNMGTPEAPFNVYQLTEQGAKKVMESKPAKCAIFKELEKLYWAGKAKIEIK